MSKKHRLAKIKESVKRQPGWFAWLEKEIDRQLKTRKPHHGKRISRTTRHKVLLRDEGCLSCGYNEGLTLHHVMPKRIGGTNHPENLVCLCEECHRQWNDMETRGEYKWFQFYQWL